MHLKVFMKLEKTRKTLSSGQKNPKKPKKPKKTQKNPKKPKKTHWAGLFKKKPGFFPTLGDPDPDLHQNVTDPPPLVCGTWTLLSICSQRRGLDEGSLQYLPVRLRRSLSQAGLIYRSCSHCNYAWIRLSTSIQIRICIRLFALFRICLWRINFMRILLLFYADPAPHQSDENLLH